MATEVYPRPDPFPNVNTHDFHRPAYVAKKEPIQYVEVIAERTAKIQMEKIVFHKADDVKRDLSGAVAITKDDNHTGWLHILILIGQFLNAFLTFRSRENINLCHAEIILGRDTNAEKPDNFIFAHALIDGIKTTSENPKIDEVITEIEIYLPKDGELRKLLVKHAKQAAVRIAKDDPNFKERIKKEQGQFTISGLISAVFYRQVVKPTESNQKKAALAAADLFKGGLLKDKSGNNATYYCTGFMMTLLQGTALVNAFTEQEKTLFKDMDRNAIANYIVDKIRTKPEGNMIAATYWENEFMKLDAKHTMSYFAGEVFDRARA